MSENERDEQQQRGFKVEDRRRFSASGDPRDGASPEPSAQAPAADEAGADEATQAATEPSAAAARPSASREPLPDINFTTFIMGLSTQALMLLGEIQDPEHPEAAADLVGAKQFIDILGMLRDKTQGNLAADEQHLLDTILYDLRLRYVERAKRSPGA